MLYSVNEIFYSIQGEGYWAGTPAVFIRLAGCNLQCAFCDTDFSVKQHLDEEELLAEGIHLSKPDEFYSPICVVTGGEPTTQSIDGLVGCLFTSFYVQIETNGTQPGYLKDLRHQYPFWLTVSPKHFDREEEDSVKMANEVKIVFENPSTIKLWEKIIPSKLFLKRRAFIQPCSEDYGPAIEYVKKNPQWRLSVQIHKCIGAR